MSERRKSDRRKSEPAPNPAGYADPVSTAMASLLSVHAALTPEWLIDAACSAAERTLNATFTFVYFEEQDGRLAPLAPASDIRRRSLQRAVDAFGFDMLRTKLDPADASVVVEALDTRNTINTTPAEIFGGVAPKAAEAAAALGLPAATIVPLENAGERLGALVMLLHATPADKSYADHARLLGEHVASAAVNLRQTHQAREQGVIDIVRSVFDARKFETELSRELSRADRYRHEAAIVVIEATNLRLLRERFGRFLVDQLVQALGEQLAEHSRDIDVIGAYKDTGYAMILTEANTDGAAVAAERLLEAAVAVRISDDVPGLELHLVAGYASFPADGKTTDALFASVERRMYGLDQAKVAS